MNSEDILHNGKKVGVKIGKVYMSYRKQSSHLYRGGLPTVQAAKKAGKAAWGIDHELIKLLGFRDVSIIAICDSDTKKVYWMSIDRFNRDSQFLDFGHGLQKFAPLSSWRSAEVNKFMQTIATMEGVK